MRIFGALQMRQAGLRDEERAARVDAHHQVEALHVGRFGGRQGNGAGIVRALHLLLIADITDDRQCHAAGILDFLGGSVDRAFQFGMRLGRLGGDRHTGAIARRTLGNGEANATATTGDEERLVLERGHAGILFMSRCRKLRASPRRS